MSLENAEQSCRVYLQVFKSDEWYKAAFYAPALGVYFDDSTGSDSTPGRDVTEATNPGNNANYLDAGNLLGPPYYRTPVGEFELSPSPYRTFDQGGNLWEWNEAVITLTDSYRGLRGGAFDNNSGSMLASYRSYCDPPLEGDSIGLGVARVPEPATMILLAVGGLAVLRRR